MIGAVWFALIVHYPIFLRFTKEQFSSLEKFHLRRALFLTIPVMLIEAITALLLLWQFHGKGIFLANVILLGLIWAITFGVCLPRHFRLSKGFTAPVFQQLVQYHLFRVILWTIRGVLLFFAAQSFQ